MRCSEWGAQGASFIKHAAQGPDITLVAEPASAVLKLPESNRLKGVMPLWHVA